MDDRDMPSSLLKPPLRDTAGAEVDKAMQRTRPHLWYGKPWTLSFLQQYYLTDAANWCLGMLTKWLPSSIATSAANRGVSSQALCHCDLWVFSDRDCL